MPRPELEALQESLLLELLPHAYEHSPLIRETWETARVHPRDMRTLDDFGERVPFIDKDAVRRFRDERGDPYGGMLCVEPSELTGVSSTSGTTGDPTLVPERVGAAAPRRRRSSRVTSGVGACAPATTSCSCCSRSAGRPTGCSRARSGPRRSSSTSTPPRWSGSASCRSQYRPTALYNFGSVLINAVKDVCDRRGFDPRDVFSSYKGVTFAGEPLSPARPGDSPRAGASSCSNTATSAT